MTNSTIAFDARYVNDRYHGIGRHAYHSIEALTRLDPDRRYLVFYHPLYPNKRFDVQVLAGRPNVRVIPLRLPLHTPIEQFVWPVLLARGRATLFHSPYVSLPLLAATRTVVTIHDTIFERYPEYMPYRWLRSVYRAQTSLGVRRADAVLTVSQASRRDIEAYYPASRGKVFVTSSGVDVSFRRVDDRHCLEAVRERYGLPERFVLALGAGRPHKNIGALVEAFAALGSGTSRALVIAGESDPRFPDPVRELVRARHLDGRVIHPGAIRETDLPALYSLAEVFVFPSLIEGFGTPPLEAMACGTPVVASNASSVPEVVGDAARTFDPRDVTQLTASLARVLEDAPLRADLGRRGRQRAAEFTWDGVARATLAAYAVVLAARGRRPTTPGGR